MLEYTAGKIPELASGNIYDSPRRRHFFLYRAAPSGSFYTRLILLLLNLSNLVKRGRFDSRIWVRKSAKVMRILESTGVRFHIENFNILREMEPPCVFLANHMSTLETFVLPSILVPFMPVTFVIKESLSTYPVLKHIIMSCDPIVVGRVNPRDDLKKVLHEGMEHLKSGVSVIIFPQRTRSILFDPRHFNTIGIKLALRAGVPVVPIALKTDAWGNGRRIKDLGKIDPDKSVIFSIGKPIPIQGRGKKEHEQIVRYIGQKLKEWDHSHLAEDAQSSKTPEISH
jgi:1-acyl-sn-glycerol-3-phosphate acyltransferase